ncbi:Lipoprotein [Tenacibaculum sp. 190524A05c]
MKTMIKKILLQITFILSGIVTYSQTNSIYPDFTKHSLNKVVKEENWKVLIKVEGSLNKNKQKDVVLVLESKDSLIEQRIGERARKNLPRILVVFLDDKIIVQNNTFIARGDEGGMLLNLKPEISIDKDELIIYYQYTRGNQSYTFKMVKNNLCLIKAQSHDVHSSSGDTEGMFYDFKKKSLTITKGNISSASEKDEKEIYTIELKNGLKKLSEFAEMYKWEVLEGRYL